MCTRIILSEIFMVDILKNTRGDFSISKIIEYILEYVYIFGEIHSFKSERLYLEPERGNRKRQGDLFFLG